VEVVTCLKSDLVFQIKECVNSMLKWFIELFSFAGLGAEFVMDLEQFVNT